MNKRETRSYFFEIRAEEDDRHGRHITGRPIVYGQRTDIGFFDEIIEPGALDGANLKDVPFLVNHDDSMIPLARSRNNNDHSTMQMVIDNEGMGIRVDLDTENNADAKSLYSAVSRGDISGMSFCFTVDKERWDGLESAHPLRHVDKFDAVLEVSAVTWPAYEGTSIEARGKAGTLESIRATLESARAKASHAENRKADDCRREKEGRTEPAKGHRGNQAAEREARARRARALALKVRMLKGEDG